jgi:hypothetical protein
MEVSVFKMNIVIFRLFTPTPKGSYCTVEFLDGGGRDIYHIRARSQTEDESMGPSDRTMC